MQKIIKFFHIFLSNISNFFISLILTLTFVFITQSIAHAKDSEEIIYNINIELFNEAKIHDFYYNKQFILPQNTDTLNICFDNKTDTFIRFTYILSKNVLNSSKNKIVEEKTVELRPFRDYKIKEKIIDENTYYNIKIEKVEEYNKRITKLRRYFLPMFMLNIILFIILALISIYGYNSTKAKEEGREEYKTGPLFNFMLYFVAVSIVCWFVLTLVLCFLDYLDYIK